MKSLKFFSSIIRGRQREQAGDKHRVVESMKAGDEHKHRVVESMEAGDEHKHRVVESMEAGDEHKHRVVERMEAGDEHKHRVVESMEAGDEHKHRVLESMEAAAGTKLSSKLDALPEELLAEILGRLPTVNRAQARSVCKTWNRIITSHAAVGPDNEQPWLFICRMRCFEADGPAIYKGVLRGYDPVSSRWFGFNVPKTGDNHELEQLELCGGGLGGGNSGLVLLREGRVDKVRNRLIWHYWVGNPLLQRWQHVLADRKLFVRNAHYEHVMVDLGAKGFKILCFQFQFFTDFRYCTVHIYDSEASQWRRKASRWVGPEGDRLIRHAGVTVSKGVVYFPFQTGSEDMRIVGYVVEDNRFEAFSEFPEPRAEIPRELMWLFIDDCHPRPTPPPESSVVGRFDFPMFSQNQSLDGAKYPGNLFFLGSRRMYLILHALCAGDFKRLYVGVISSLPHFADDLVMYDSSEWRHVPHDREPRGFLNSISAGTFMPRFDAAVNISKPDMHLLGSSDAPSCLACMQLPKPSLFPFLKMYEDMC